MVFQRGEQIAVAHTQLTDHVTDQQHAGIKRELTKWHIPWIDFFPDWNEMNSSQANNMVFQRREPIANKHTQLIANVIDQLTKTAF